MNTVDSYISKNASWKDMLVLLRGVLLNLGLEETIKWRSPVYMYQGKNIVGLGAFKNYVGLWFFQGATLKDASKFLINAQEGKTTAMRQWRFSSINEIHASYVIAYVQEAIQNQHEGKVILPKKNVKPLLIPKELAKILQDDAQLLKHFEELSMFQKREFCAYISEAKRDSTKLARISKIVPMILEGKGLNDAYR